MTRVEPSAVTRVAVVGTGTIGGGWAACFLAQGLEVAATDPAPGAEARMRDFVARAWPALEALGGPVQQDPKKLIYTPSLERALEGAQFVQENATEDEAFKVELFARMDGLLPVGVVIASSTSSFLVSQLQSQCRYPGRCVLGHPFNPPHIVPLVEVAGGAETDPAAVDWAMAFYRHIGKTPVRLDRETYRHIANRLQAVVWNEAVRLVEEGVASPADIDAAVAYGPGLRWAIMGPFLTRHLGGGAGGLEKSLEMFGEPEVSANDRARLRTVSGAAKERLLAVLDSVTGGRSISELEEERDRALVAILQAIAATRR